MASPLLRFSFWFSGQTQPFIPWVAYTLITVIIALLIAAIVIQWRRRMLEDKLLRKVWGKVFACTLSAGLIGLVLYFFTWQRVPVFGMRIFWPIWFIAHIAWGYAIWVKARREIPAMREAQAKRAAYEKWLPKSKRS